MTASIPTVDCRGMRCPAPILQIAKTARKAGRDPVLFEVLADDDDFPKDLQAWCRTAKATLHELGEEGGVHRALVGLNGAERPAVIDGTPRGEASVAPPAIPAGGLPPLPAGGLPAQPVAAPRPPIGADPFAPRPEASPAGAVAAPAVPAPSAPPRMMASSRPAPELLTELDLRGLRAPTPMVQLSQLLGSHAGHRVRVTCDDPTFLTDVMGWAAAMRVTVTATRTDEHGTVVELLLPASGGVTLAPAVPAAPRAVPAPIALAAPAPTPSTALALDDGTSPRENLASILVLRNDFESLMASLLVANGAAAQGMDVNVYFSFWGVNLLRGERPRADVPAGKVSWLQKLMKWMMPKGPRRQTMSKMHMGGAGKGMMEFFIKKNNVMTLPELLDSCVEQNVTFTVCTMSMGIMGVEKRDIMDLPNIEWGGVATFVENSKRASMSLVF